MSEALLRAFGASHGGDGLWSAAWRRLRSNRAAVLAAALLAGVVVAAVLGPWVSPHDMESVDWSLSPLASPPSIANGHWFGTDANGRDLFVRVWAGTRVSLLVALLASVVSLVIGVAWGATAGYLGGRVDEWMMRFVDILMAFPGFLLALTVTAVLGNNIRTIVFALGIAYAPVMIRVVRAQVLSLREAQFIEASQAIGTPTWEIIFYHLLPNTYSVLLAQATLFLAWAVLDIAGLSFLGLGIKPPTPELGAMTAEGAEQMISGRWWMSVFPGGFIMLMALTFTLIGDGLRDILDPRYQR